MTDNVVESKQNLRTSPRWLHWVNLFWNVLVFLGAGSLSLVLFRWNPETGADPFVSQLSNRTVLIWAYMVGFVALMAIIALVDSLRRLAGRAKPSRSNRAGWLKFTILLFPLVVVALDARKYSDILPDWVFSFLVFLGVLIPVIWLVRMASGHLWGRHKGCDASIISFSGTVTIPYIILIQGLLMVIGFMLLVFFGLQELAEFSGSLAEIEEILASPLVILGIVTFLSVIAPLVEELLKTLAVFPLLGLGISEGDGYVAGLMSGGAFALLEGALYAAQTAQAPGGEWAYFLVGRLGGTLIHVFNGGLVGWALAKTWKDRNFARLIVIYLTAFFIHGIWNLVAALTQLIPGILNQEVNEISSVLILTIITALISIGFFYFARHILRTDKHMQVNRVA